MKFRKKSGIAQNQEKCLTDCVPREERVKEFMHIS